MSNKIVQSTREEIQHKKELLDNAEKVLKQEFIGIDGIIDTILNNIRPWYFYPNLQERPLVQVLVGQTGSGKTSVVQRLVKLLDLEKDLVYYNFAQIGEMSSWQVEDEINNSLLDTKPNRVFVYDEFQYAATLNKMGEEKDNKSGLKPFWELLDTGKFHRKPEFYYVGTVKSIVRYLSLMDIIHPINFKNGIIWNGEDYVNELTEYEKYRIGDYLQIGINNKNSIDEPRTVNEYASGSGIVEQVNESEDKPGNKPKFFLTERAFERIHTLYTNCYGWVDKMDIHRRLENMQSYDEVMEFMVKLSNDGMKGYDMDYSKSIIFVLANIDEAYSMSFDVDPDMSPDAFHEVTKKLTIVDIKEALQKRFRNEQIARLGNSYLIYPSFSSESFRGIINLQLQRYTKNVYEKYGVNVDYDESIHQLIYDESVFPTHGTRPVISSVYEIIQTKLPYVMDELSENEVTKVARIHYYYADMKVFARVFDEEDVLIKEMSFTQELRLDRNKLSDNREKQAVIAAHESGHFVMYLKTRGVLPEKLCSKTVSKGTGGFMIHNTSDVTPLQSKDEILDYIATSLGGYVAEEMVFGKEHITAGASEDLAKATITASKMVRYYGMGNNTVVTTYLIASDVTAGGNILKEDSNDMINTEVKNIINACLNTVRMTLSNPVWKKLLKESALYLTEHAVMPKEKMQELYDQVPDNMKYLHNENKFKELLEKF